MSLGQTEDLIDCLSAKELLQALNTLQQISTDNPNELELSFSKSSHSLFNTVDNKNQMDFLMYMELKNASSKNPKSNNAKPSSKTNIKQNQKNPHNFNKKSTVGVDMTEKAQSRTPQRPKSKTPLKSFPLQEQNINHTNNITKQSLTNTRQLKSRSHSPLTRHPQKNNQSHHRSIYYGTKQLDEQLQTIKQSELATRRSTNLHHNFNKPVKNKENKELVDSKQQQPAVKVSDKSKRIMIEREKNGKTYVPIHERTCQLIREKQEKIAKLQRASLAQKQLEERECTFKPMTNTNNRKYQRGNHARTYTTVSEIDTTTHRNCQYDTEANNINMIKNKKQKDRDQERQKQDVRERSQRSKSKKRAEKMEIELDFI